MTVTPVDRTTLRNLTKSHDYPLFNCVNQARRNGYRSESEFFTFGSRPLEFVRYTGCKARAYQATHD